MPVIYDLLEHRGFALAAGLGVDVAGAIRLARQLGTRPHRRDDPVREFRQPLSIETFTTLTLCLPRAFRTAMA